MTNETNTPGKITDNLETQTHDMPAGQLGMTTSPQVPHGTKGGAVQTPEKFDGQDREQVLKSYLNLEKEYSELSEKSKQLENWCNRVGVFFKLDDQDRVTLNEDMVKAFAETRGWIDQWKTEQSPPAAAANQGPKMLTKEQVMEQFENDPMSMIKKAVQEVLQEEIKPIREQMNMTQQNFANSQYQQWINEVRGENQKEFDDLRLEMGKLIKDFNLEDKIRGPNDLRKILAWTKASTGRMIDKSSHEDQMNRLNQTLSILDPSYGRNTGRSMDPEASVEELLGVGSNSLNSPKAKVTQALFGKTALRP